MQVENIMICISLLNADGKMYETFDDQTYEIVGIYDLTSNPVGDYALAEIEVFIPYNAVKGSWDKGRELRLKEY